MIELKKIVTEKLLILLTQAFLGRGYWEQVQKDSTFKITKNYHTKLKLAGLWAFLKLLIIDIFDDIIVSD